MSDEELDRVFREKLQPYEAAPSSRIWQNIAMDLQPEKRPVNNRIWMVAASFLLVISLGMLLLPGKTPVRLQASQSSEVEPVGTVESPKELPKTPREAKSVLFLERLASIKFEGNKHAKNYKERGRAISDNIASISHVEQIQVAAPVKAQPVLDEPISPAVDTDQQMVEEPEATPVLAMADPQHGRVDDQPKRIRSVGDIVNFLVRQVDPRKEKIIEFTSNDDETSVSSINLGVLKIRTKQNDAKLN